MVTVNKNHIDITMVTDEKDELYTETVRFLKKSLSPNHNEYLTIPSPQTETFTIAKPLSPKVVKESYYGYRGFIGREEAESLLVNKTPGCFLVRWSDRANSYVVSFKTSNGITHSSDILKGEGESVNIKASSGRKTFANLREFVDAMIREGDLTYPVPEDE